MKFVHEIHVSCLACNYISASRLISLIIIITMTSKLDYLKKYGIGSDRKAGNDEPKKKKKKSSHHSDGRIIVHDDEFDWMKQVKAGRKEVIDPYGGLYEEDDKPLVVDEVQAVGPVSRGSWEEIDIPVKPNHHARSSHTVASHRHDSDDEAPLRKPSSNKTSRRRDSDDEAPPRRASGRHDSDDEVPPRRSSIRHDRDDEAPPPKPSSNIASRRHHSDDEAPPRREFTKHDSEDEVPLRKTVSRPSSRHDSDDDEAPPRRPSGRHDSDDEAPPRKSESTKESKSNGQHTTSRHDSDDDEAPPRRDQPSKTTERAKTSSGHYAGLQTGETFGKTERQLHETNQKLLTNADKTLSGAYAETVYRDKSGKKVDMLEEYMRKEALTQGKQAKILAAQQEYGRGTAQKEQMIDKLRELEEIAQEPFARTIDDPKLELWKKEQLREGDPMAAYFLKKKDKDASARDPGKPSKPIYRGPNAPVNRFGLRPGYRWDGIDRGNGFENKVLNKGSEKISNKEDEYLWSVADM
jgi:pre-mRNA-splicing factor CWC26